MKIFGLFDFIMVWYGFLWLLLGVVFVLAIVLIRKGVDFLWNFGKAQLFRLNVLIKDLLRK